MTRGRIVALVAAVLLLLPGLGLLFAGGSLGLGWLSGDREGYASQMMDPVRTEAVAVVSSDVGVIVDAGVPGGLIARLDLEVRLDAQALNGSGPLFVGIGPSEQVSRYLTGSAHDRVARVDGTRLVLEQVPGGGGAPLPAPVSEPFWVESAQGPGVARLDWKPTAGSYSVVVMNADGSPGVRAEVVAAGRAGLLGPLAALLLVLGAVVTAAAVGLMVLALRNGRRRPGGPGGSGRYQDPWVVAGPAWCRTGAPVPGGPAMTTVPFPAYRTLTRPGRGTGPRSVSGSSRPSSGGVGCARRVVDAPRTARLLVRIGDCPAARVGHLMGQSNLGGAR